MRHLSILSVLVGLLGICLRQLKGEAAPPAPSGSILVLPFSSPSTDADGWVGKAVQQDLLTDLTQGTTLQAVGPASVAPAADADAAIHAARDKGAAFVVYGQAQKTDKEVRLSGQVLDVSSGKPIGALKATGPSDELFHLEDALAGQVFMALPRDLLTAAARQGVQTAMANRQAAQAGPQAPGNGAAWPNGPYSQPAVNPSSIYGNPPTETPQPQVAPPPVYDGGTTYNYTYYDTTPDTGYYAAPYSYGYPYYGYADWGVWPFYGLGFYVSPGFGFHDHFDGRGHFDGHGFDHHFGSGFRNNFNTSRGGFSRSGAGVRTAPSSSFGGSHAATGGGFRSAGGGIRSGGFGGASMGGARGGFSGGGFHGGGGGGGGHR
jgi:TolB-like protein